MLKSFRGAVAIAAAVLLALGSFQLLGSDGSGDAKAAAAADGAAAGAKGKTRAAGGSASSGATAGTSSGDAAKAGTAGGAAAMKPPAAGRYQWHVTGTFSGLAAAKKIDEMHLLDISKAERTASGWQQRQVTTREGSSTEVREVWSGDRIVYTSSKTGSSNACTYTPPVLRTKLPLRVGDSWTVERSTCAEGGEGAYGKFATTVRVMRKQTISVGGAKVECFIIDEVGETTLDGQTVKLRELRWFAPRYGMVVKINNIVSMPTGKGSFTQVLTSVNPVR